MVEGVRDGGGKGVNATALSMRHAPCAMRHAPCALTFLIPKPPKNLGPGFSRTLRKTSMLTALRYIKVSGCDPIPPPPPFAWDRLALCKEVPGSGGEDTMGSRGNPPPGRQGASASSFAGRESGLPAAYAAGGLTPPAKELAELMLPLAVPKEAAQRHRLLGTLLPAASHAGR